MRLHHQVSWDASDVTFYSLLCELCNLKFSQLKLHSSKYILPNPSIPPPPTHTPIHTPAHTHSHTHTPAHTHSHTHTRAHTHTPAHSHTYTHAHSLFHSHSLHLIYLRQTSVLLTSTLHVYKSNYINTLC